MVLKEVTAEYGDCTLIKFRVQYNTRSNERVIFTALRSNVVSILESLGVIAFNVDEDVNIDFDGIVSISVSIEVNYVDDRILILFSDFCKKQIIALQSAYLSKTNK